jgi:hypothetical protein
MSPKAQLKKREMELAAEDLALSLARLDARFSGKLDLPPMLRESLNRFKVAYRGYSESIGPRALLN